MAVDFNRIAAAAAEALLADDERRADRHVAKAPRFGRVGALAVGVGLGIAARAAYRRARSFDLEQVAGSLEDRLKG